MNARIIHKSAFLEMPWANGAGVTTELFVHKDEHSGRILWRLSVAGVDTDGPFSHFPGYDRILVLMAGHGLRLNHADDTRHELDKVYDLAVFPGDVATHATLCGGPVKDFNVIVDRAGFRSAVTVVQAGGTCVRVAADVLAVFAVDNDLEIVDPGRVGYRVSRADLLLVDGPRSGDWAFSGATAIVTRICAVRDQGGVA
jgi:environmental stress-induced protein Ves